jgi:hypothetical protein
LVATKQFSHNEPYAWFLSRLLHFWQFTTGLKLFVDFMFAFSTFDFACVGSSKTLLPQTAALTRLQTETSNSLRRDPLAK